MWKRYCINYNNKKKQTEDIIFLTAKKDEELEELIKLEDEVWLQRSIHISLEGGDTNTNSSIEKLLKGIKQIRSKK